MGRRARGRRTHGLRRHSEPAGYVPSLVVRAEMLNGCLEPSAYTIVVVSVAKASGVFWKHSSVGVPKGVCLHRRYE